MILITHPQARSRDARGTCVQIPALLQTLLFALLATLLGRPRLAAAAWHALTTEAWDDDDDSLIWDSGSEHPHEYGAPLTHYHADCDPSLLYVIGPRPNRGLNPRPRENPTPSPKSARAPPRPEFCESARQTISGTHALIVPLSHCFANE